MIWKCNILFVILVYLSTTYANILIDSDGGYKNIIIGITPELRVSDVESLLLELKVLLRRTSELLYIASDKKVFFKEIVFAVPKEYKVWIQNKYFLGDESDPKSTKKPNMFLTQNDIFTNLYAIQHSGCGKPGLRINIPTDFLAATSNKKALSLVRQWAKYRYGVFDESGFSGDEIYPACYRTAGSDNIRISDCTNENAVYEFEKIKREDFSHVCSPVPVSGENNQIESSIMTNIDFPEMKYFCDDESRPHNRNVPTKQNALCREKSTWEIIAGHPDFDITRKNVSNVKPTFQYVMESDPRFVVAVDTSNEMDQNDRMILVQNAFSYFLFYELPNNSTVGLMDMKSKEDPFTKTIVTENDARWLIGMFPELEGYGDICVHCTIQKLLEDLKLDIKDIILITATDIASTWIDNITTMLKSNKVALHVIYFQKKSRREEAKSAFLESVARASAGNFYYIPEAFPPGTPVSSLTVLYEAFRSIYESFSWIHKKRVLVDQMTFSNNCSPKCILSFPSDRTMGTLQVIITGPEFGQHPPILRNSIVLDNGVERFVSGNDSFIYKAEVPAFVITVRNPLTRKWSLSFERKPRYNKPVVVIVRASHADYEEIINMQSWISADNYQNGGSSSRPPITIYSEIKKGHNPVTNVEVVAFIHQASQNTEWSLKLKDSGDGDPDITKNDGIFSRYLTDVKESGYLLITVVAEKKFPVVQTEAANERNKSTQCCGSFIPDSLAFNSGSFKRVTTYQSFFVYEEMAGKTYPPRRIVDLRIEKIEILKNNMTCYVLKWTAPGDNYDKGRAFSYDLKVFSKREDAWNDFDNSNVLTIKMLNIQGPLLEPENAGTMQTAYVELKNLTSGTYFIALKTSSHSGKVSDVSNVVELTYSEQISLITDTGFSKDDYFTRPLGTSTETSSDDETGSAISSRLGLTIGLTCGILLLLIIIAIILFIYFERHKKLKKDPNAGLGQNTKKTESNDALCNSNGDGNISIISPVNSWPAGSLISHYETLQRHKNTELSVPQITETDTMSVTSSKYSYDNKMDQNSSIYDPIYFHQVRSQEEINYPYNPSYTPFDPIYTSSRPEDSDIVINPYASDNISYCSYSLNRNHLSRLKTDV
uniref:Putative calcium-activated chloride channel n=1 Tax=Cupiennius salei TaxID=6928 RepID=T1D1U5_CUPSA